MTLIERGDALAARLTAFQTNTALARQSRQLGTRAKQFTEAAAALRRVEAMREAFAANSIVVSMELSGTTPLAARATSLRDAFATNPESILTTDVPLDRTFFSPLNSLVGAMESSLTTAWQSTVLESLGSMPDALLRTIGNIRKLAPDVQTLRDLQGRGQLVAGTLPEPRTESVRQVLDVVRELSVRKADVLESLKGIPEEVIAFLHRVAAGQARLNHMTGFVRTWLDDHELTGEFKVVLG